MTSTKLDAGKRLGTMLLDHIIMTFIIMLVSAPGVVYDFITMMSNPGASPKLMLGNLYLNLLAFSLYFNKDIVLGRSPAKRILNLQVVSTRTNTAANPLQCLVRNITIVLWPVEGIVALVNPQRRIGDMIAGTRLAEYDTEQVKESVNWPLAIAALALGMLITYVVAVLPVQLLTGTIGQIQLK